MCSSFSFPFLVLLPFSFFSFLFLLPFRFCSSSFFSFLLLVSHRPWEDCKLDEVAETLGVRLGMVCIPQGETILGKIAGKWLRHTLMALARKKKAQTPLSWRQCAKTSMLLEISCFLARKLGEHIPEVTDPNFTSVLKERWQRCRSVPVAKLASLPRTDFF